MPKGKYSTVDSKEDLLSLQRFFAATIRRPLIDNETMLSEAKVDEMIVSNGKVSSHGRLQFYARQYWWRILDSFDEDFPNVIKVLEPKVYENLKMKYLVTHPSVSFTLRNLGSRFGSFIKQKPKLTAPHTKLAYDAFSFDWSRIQAFDAASAEPISPEDVLRPRFASKKLYLQPHVQLIKLNYPIDVINKDSQFVLREATSNVESKKKKAVSLKKLETVIEQETFLAVHRFQGRIFIKRISKIEFKILKKFQLGFSLKTLANESSKFGRLEEGALEKFFAEWMSLSWLYLKKSKK